MANMQQAEQLMYLEDNAHEMTEEDVQCLQNIFHKTTSICKVIYRRKQNE